MATISRHLTSPLTQLLIFTNKIQPFINLNSIVIKRMITSKEWREKHNRPKDRLSDMPDWSYTDGRGFGPPSVAQKKRYIRDQELAKEMIRRFKDLKEAKNIN
ncbi:hypothetical protein BLOT_000453 [Blomia tropicalis]|nr:hypothetical protein BLOT_000453 [Blomia tropicalis]